MFGEQTGCATQESCQQVMLVGGNYAKWHSNAFMFCLLDIM